MLFVGGKGLFLTAFTTECGMTISGRSPLSSDGEEILSSASAGVCAGEEAASLRLPETATMVSAAGGESAVFCCRGDETEGTSSPPKKNSEETWKKTFSVATAGCCIAGAIMAANIRQCRDREPRTDQRRSPLHAFRRARIMVFFSYGACKEITQDHTCFART